MKLKNKNMGEKIILASASPRRKELLSLIVKDFEVVPSDADEQSIYTNDPRELVLALACLKARDIAGKYTDAVVIGADTVVYADRKILGKPRNRQEAFEFMKLLENNVHSVFTGVCVKGKDGEIIEVCETKVCFDHMTDKEIEEYLDTGEYADKAGGYGIQGTAAKFVKYIEGCYNNVVGLPVNTVMRMLEDI